MTDHLANAAAHLDAHAFRALAATGAQALGVAVAAEGALLRARSYGFATSDGTTPAGLAEAACRLLDGGREAPDGRAPEELGLPEGALALSVAQAHDPASRLTVVALAPRGADLTSFTRAVLETFAAAVAGRALPELPPLA